MTTEKYSQLNHVHFEHRLWKNEIDTITQEVDFFDNLLNTLQTEHLIATKHEKKIGELFNQLHHFKRLTKRLNEELLVIQNEIAEGVLNENILDKEQRLDHDYFRQEMDYLEQNYRIFKKNYKSFMANTHFGKL